MEVSGFVRVVGHHREGRRRRSGAFPGLELTDVGQQLLVAVGRDAAELEVMMPVAVDVGVAGVADVEAPRGDGETEGEQALAVSLEIAVIQGAASEKDHVARRGAPGRMDVLEKALDSERADPAEAELVIDVLEPDDTRREALRPVRGQRFGAPAQLPWRDDQVVRGRTRATAQPRGEVGLGPRRLRRVAQSVGGPGGGLEGDLPAAVGVGRDAQVETLDRSRTVARRLDHPDRRTGEAVDGERAAVGGIDPQHAVDRAGTAAVVDLEPVDQHQAVGRAAARLGVDHELDILTVAEQTRVEVAFQDGGAEAVPDCLAGQRLAVQREPDAVIVAGAAVARSAQLQPEHGLAEPRGMRDVEAQGRVRGRRRVGESPVPVVEALVARGPGKEPGLLLDRESVRERSRRAAGRAGTRDRG